MSTIVLPDFMARTSLKKPLGEALKKSAVAGSSTAGSAIAPLTPHYRIRRLQVSQQAARPGAQVARPANQLNLLTAPSSGQQGSEASRGQEARTEGPRFTSIKLTRKGRLLLRGIPVLTLAALLLLGALTFLSPAEAKSSTEAVTQPVSTTVTVMHGDTMWDIAARVAPGEDNRDVINQIMQINDLTTARLEPGQVLEVPVYSSK